MSPIEGLTYFDCCRAAVDELLVADVATHVVERTIDSYALEREEQDALWLWAIGRRDRPTGNRSDLLVVE